MKKAILIAAITLSAATAFGQSKPDTTRKYTLSEPVIIQISTLLSYGDNIAGNSDKISTRDYNAYHSAVLKIDSVLREQYLRYHPAKEKKGAGK
jgi:hypothetical protein